MREIDYGTSPYKRWIQRAERALSVGRGELRNWRKIVSTLVSVAIVLAALLILLVAGLNWLDRPRKVAVIPGPSPTDRPCELWYGKGGDLTFMRWGGPAIMLADYYGDVNVVHSHWPSRDRVIMTMSDGSTLQFAVDWSGTPPTTRPAS